MKLLACVAALLLASAALAAPLDVAGRWTGSFARTKPRATFVTTSTLAQRAAALTGWLVVDGVAGEVPVTGRARRRGLVVDGELDGTTVRWIARRRPSGELRGKLRIKGPGGRAKGLLVLQRDDPAAPTCGADYFRDTVMPEVIVPVCGQCHVPGGLAELTTFRVTPDDPVATATSAVIHVNAAAPLSSRLLRKPRAELPHGGGMQLEVGSARDDVLRRWIELVADCTGGGGERTGASLYADYCAGCHGPDARGATSALGVEGQHIRCHRGIADAVRTGRTSTSGDMPTFAELGDADVAAIGDYLTSLCPPGSAGGDELFASNCSHCHGDDAGGLPAPPGERRRPAVRCATAPWIAAAVMLGRADAMPSFPGLVATDVDALTTFLDEACAQMGRIGSDLYDGNCASCHGAAAGGGRSALGVVGPDVRCSSDEKLAERIADGEDEMPAFPALTLDAAAIGAYVRGSFCDED